MAIGTEHKGLSVRRSRNGRGVFANKSFALKEEAVEIKGQLMTCYADEDIDETVRQNTFRYSKNLFLSPRGTLGEFFNHSCEPNIRIVKKKKSLFAVAIKDIPKGAEVVFDYSTITASDDIWTMQCNCGSKDCRKKIGRFVSLSKRLRDRYIAERIVPSYILGL